MPYSARSLARMVMPTLLRHEWSPSRIRSYLSVKGYVYNRLLMASDLREMQNSYNFGRRLMSLPPETMPTKRELNEVELRADRKYKVIGRATIRDEATGKLSYEYKAFYTDELQNKEGLEQDFIEAIGSLENYQGRQIEAFEVLELQHKQGWPY